MYSWYTPVSAVRPPLTLRTQIFVFSSTGQNLAASILGAVSSQTTTSGTAVAAYGNDMYADPATASARGWLTNGACSGVGADAWTVRFPPAAGYPLGLPTLISSVVYVNRMDSCCWARVNTSASVIQLIAPNGTVVQQAPIPDGRTVTTLTFANAQTTAIAPDPTSAFQTSAANRLALPRYIRIASAPATCLHFRELYVFDTTLTNVALFKTTTASVGALYTDASGSYTPSMGVDGVIDMDNAAGNMYNSPCDGSGWWQVDLGGVYALSSLMFFNRYATTLVAGFNGTVTGVKASGATLTYLNYYGTPIGSTTLTGQQIQNISVVTIPPTPTVSGTASVSSTSSTSLSSSPSHTFGSTGTGTASTSATTTQTPTVTASSSQTATVTISPSQTPPVTPSPLSPNPASARLQQTNTAVACSNHMDFVEVRPSRRSVRGWAWSRAGGSPLCVA